MLKYLRILLLLFLIFFLSNCERYVTEVWQISNQSSENIEIIAVDFWNSIDNTNSISPGSVITIADIRRINAIASTVAANQEEVDVDTLVITNSGLQEMNRDPKDFGNWNAEAVTDNIVEYTLVVTDDDFN